MPSGPFIGPRIVPCEVRCRARPLALSNLNLVWMIYQMIVRKCLENFDGLRLVIVGPCSSCGYEWPLCRLNAQTLFPKVPRYFQSEGSMSAKACSQRRRIVVADNPTLREFPVTTIRSPSMTPTPRHILAAHNVRNSAPTRSLEWQSIHPRNSCRSVDMDSGEAERQ